MILNEGEILRRINYIQQKGGNAQTQSKSVYHQLKLSGSSFQSETTEYSTINVTMLSDNETLKIICKTKNQIKISDIHYWSRRYVIYIFICFKYYNRNIHFNVTFSITIYMYTN